MATLDPRLREYDLGERTGLTMAEFAEQFPAEHAQRLAGRYDVVAGAESTADVLARMVPACRELVGSVAAGETAVAVTHGAALRVALVELLGWPPAAADSLRVLGNCAVAVLDGGPDGAPMRLVAYNATPNFASLGAAG